MRTAGFCKECQLDFPVQFARPTGLNHQSKPTFGPNGRFDQVRADSLHNTKLYMLAAARPFELFQALHSHYTVEHANPGDAHIWACLKRLEDPLWSSVAAAGAGNLGVFGAGEKACPARYQKPITFAIDPDNVEVYEGWAGWRE